MINSANSLHILHRANAQLTQQQEQQHSRNEDASENIDNNESHNRAQSPVQNGDDDDDDHPLNIPLLPQGLEYEVASCDAEHPANTEEQDDRAEDNVEEERGKYASKECKLSFFFVMLVLTGVGNILAAKAQAISMYNYGVFLSLFSYLIYVPLCFAFILPTAKYGWFDNAIPPEHMALPKRPFAIMGFLDCLAAVMQTFASIYLPGSLLVLLPQFSIPMSMVLSKHMLGERYRAAQYVGAVVVVLGLLIVLEPVATYRHEPDYLCEAIDLENHCTICHEAVSRETCLLTMENTVGGNWFENQSLFPTSSKGNASIDILMIPTVRESMRILLDPNETEDEGPDDDAICQWLPLSEASTGREWSVFVWSIVMVLSCVPMTLSSVYKQIKLRAHGDLHPVFLIGWIGVFQFIFSIISAPSVGWATGLPIRELPQNVWGGLKCYFGQSSVESGCHPDSLCSSGHAFLFVNLCLFCQAMYMLCMVFVLKYGSTSLLYLALTMMVPLGNVIFSLPFVTSASLYISDVIALLVIVLGLLLYRFGHKLPPRRRRRNANTTTDDGQILPAEDESDLPAEPCHPLLEPLIAFAYV